MAADPEDRGRQERHNNDVGKPRWSKAYSFAFVTAGLFLISWGGQFIAQMYVVRQDA
jgi:hypothetical protein